MSATESHLSRISTLWSVHWRAHRGDGDVVTAAQHQLLMRYHGAVYRYLLGTVRNPNAAEELTQEFAVRFLRGDFRQADPGRGRFRDFLKTALRHLVIDHWRRQEKEQKGAQVLVADPAARAEEDSEAEFLQGWREELLTRTWEALAQEQEQSGAPYHTVLRCRVEQPEASSAELVRVLEQRLGKAFREGNLRVTLHRARQRFADLLLDEVARSLKTDDPDQVEQELIDLELLEYCRSALQRRRDDAS